MDRVVLVRHATHVGDAGGVTAGDWAHVAQNQTTQGVATADTCGVVADEVAHDPAHEVLDDDLLDVVEAWPTLPKAVRAGVLAMVRTAGGR